MKIKDYSREYERVFTGEDLIKKKCDIGKVSVYNDKLSIEEYQNLYREHVREFYANIFDSLVKSTWLNRQFCYRGNRRIKPNGNGVELDRAFGVYTRRYLNHDNRFVTRNTSFGKVVSYFDDFFPNFEEGNPFEQPYLYPYKYMTLENLVTVYQMDERLELLSEGEEKQMAYTDFLDYVLNYISCYNEEHGEHYLFSYSHVFMPYIKKL